MNNTLKLSSKNPDANAGIANTPANSRCTTALIIRRVCFDYRITQRRLWLVLGKSRRTISRYANGSTIPGIYVLNEIAAYLKITPAQLLKFGRMDRK